MAGRFDPPPQKTHLGRDNPKIYYDSVMIAEEWLKLCDDIEYRGNDGNAPTDAEYCYEYEKMLRAARAKRREEEE